MSYPRNWPLLHTLCSALDLVTALLRKHPGKLASFWNRALIMRTRRTAPVIFIDRWKRGESAEAA
jgi:hypothetical protein